MFQKNVPRGDPSGVRKYYAIIIYCTEKSDVHVVIVDSHRQVQLLNTIFDLGIKLE